MEDGKDNWGSAAARPYLLGTVPRRVIIYHSNSSVRLNNECLTSLVLQGCRWAVDKPPARANQQGDAAWFRLTRKTIGQVAI